MKITAALSVSPIEKISVAGHKIYIKRDDLLNTHFSGNKARKFAYYLQNNQDLDSITHLVSYGSIQANSLYSLAALAYLKGWQLDYYVNRIPSWLKGSTLGNYGQAVALGANIIELDDALLDSMNINSKVKTENLDSIMTLFSKSLSNNNLFIPEGGRHSLAQIGINTLAQEISDYCLNHGLFSHPNEIQIMLPSGTGTTALFLQTWFKENNISIEVLTCPCVGDDSYLQQQFYQLNTKKDHWPTILKSNKKFHFAKLEKSHYQLWQQLLQETKIEFDLLYDPIGWQYLLEYMETLSIEKNKNSTTIFYLHQGGLVGNQTMLPRYKRKYPEMF